MSNCARCAWPCRCSKKGCLLAESEIDEPTKLLVPVEQHARDIESLQAENARLTSEVARLREEGALQRAINRAAEKLPYPYTINLSVECGAGWVSVDAGDEAWQVEANDRTMAQQVEDEITAALAKP